MKGNMLAIKIKIRFFHQNSGRVFQVLGKIHKGFTEACRTGIWKNKRPLTIIGDTDFIGSKRESGKESVSLTDINVTRYPDTSDV